MIAGSFYSSRIATRGNGHAYGSVGVIVAIDADWPDAAAVGRYVRPRAAQRHHSRQ
jgi:hypothetical protein